MNVAVCSWNSPEYQDLANVSQPGKEEYCARHGYTFVPVVGEFKVGGYERYDVVRDLLPQYDLVLMLDADALVMNHTLKAERLYREGKSIYCAADLMGVNDGAIMFARAAKSMQLISVFLACGRKPGNEMMDSQQMLRWFIEFHPYAPHVQWVEQNEMNSYRNDLYGRPDWFDGTYHKGDWILQFPGMSNADRIPHMQEALKEVIR